VVRATSDRGRASSRLLGVNHHYNRNGYGLWSAPSHSPVPAVVKESRRAGLQSVRFPGGTIANLFDWKRAIGPHHGCQVNGTGTPETGFPAVRHRLAFGVDEYMSFLRAIGAAPLIMVPFVTSRPIDAADWVEYMNAPAGVAGNPNGGVDWADVRADNGHPRPYEVRRWEIGNEQDHPTERYWMAANDAKAVKQYAFGGERTIVAEPLGRNCAHPLHGVAADGSADQHFEVLYPPVKAASVKVLVGGTGWDRVADLSSSGPRDRVFRVRAASGTIVFGDGVHGAVPPAEASVTASYTSVHAGFFSFARRMKAVDPHIRVCSSWGTPAFVVLARGRHDDCLTTHPITTFGGSRGHPAHWSRPLVGHDAFMQAAERRRRQVVRLLDVLPSRTPLWLTEASTIHGDTDTFPSWATSASHAAYMASLWADWMNLRIPWGMGDDLLWTNDRAVLGPAPDYAFTADAVTRQALRPMFEAGGKVLATSVENNPVRRPRSGSSYAALAVCATRRKRRMFVMVVNRLPTTDVTARIRFDGARVAGRMSVRRVAGSSFQSWNPPGEAPSVRLVRRSRSVHGFSFEAGFPAASTTVFRIRVASGGRD
jgi:alpha-N-arabinofuranosidase